ncbi:unnamed protein product [Staurois parvus]|uniref:Uncharacterized protein n=1 Tax=Staurois parvus TaxID=386267 RepID=A0ABN9C9P3_9NEOB|nr:unnamed protein product [Staurois parvus]
MTAGCPVRMMREALVLCDWSGGFWDLSCVPGTALPFTKSTASCACALGTRLLSRASTLQKPEDSTLLDRGTGKVPLQS